MNETERVRVGLALDVLRDTLAGYVDDAMIAAYGERWDDVVAADDAKRRNGRKFRVNKRDLVVLLKAIIHRRIEPWSSVSDPQRVRAFASELLSVRHQHHHGEDCFGEYARFLDTACRLLTSLGLVVPSGLEPIDQVAEGASSPIDPTREPTRASSPPISLPDAEVERLGEPGERLVSLLGRAAELSRAVQQQCMESFLALDPDEPDLEGLQEGWVAAYENTGTDVVQLLGELQQIEADTESPRDAVLQVLTVWVRCELTSGVLGMAALVHLSSAMLSLTNDRDRRLLEWAERLARGEVSPEGGLPDDFDGELTELTRLTESLRDESDRWQRLVDTASQLEESNAVANLATVRADLELAAAKREEAGMDGGREALHLVQDAIARLRFEAGRELGSSAETGLILALRLEGQISNDLGLSDEAIHAFARAEEIVDRYPSADPALLPR